jgi:hypothetical protein
LSHRANGLELFKSKNPEAEYKNKIEELLAENDLLQKKLQEKEIQVEHLIRHHKGQGLLIWNTRKLYYQCK